MATRTIGRNATRKIADIKARTTKCVVHSLSNNFIGAECDPAAAWGDLGRLGFARLQLDDSGRRAQVNVHENLWYELTLSA